MVRDVTVNAAWYERLLRETAPVLRARFKPDCCLNAAWIVSEVLRRATVPSEALLVDVVAMNRAYAEATKRLGRVPETRAEAGPSAWSVMVDSDPRLDDADRFGGHCVVLADGHVLLDASAAQMRRPKHRIETRAVWCEVDRFWRMGAANVVLSLPKGGLLMYRARPQDRRHVGTLGYSDTEHNIEAADAIWSRLERSARSA